MDLKRGIDIAVNAAVADKKYSAPCKDDKAIAQVGTISANSDESIVALLLMLWQSIGQRRCYTVGRRFRS